MNESNKMVEILSDIKGLLSHNKKILNVDDLSSYTGLSKSKIYKLLMLKLIPTNNNEHVRQKFFDKDVIDSWLMGNPDVSDEFLEMQFDQQLLRNKKA